MGRLPGFDYKRPFFYMATIKRAAGAALQHPFSAISPEGSIVPNAITEAFEKEIAALPQQWPYVESLSPHVIMPDHLHLMVKLGRPGATPAALGTIVAQLKKRLREAYWGVVGGAAGAALQGQGFARAAPAARRRNSRGWDPWRRRCCRPRRRQGCGRRPPAAALP